MATLEHRQPGYTSSNLRKHTSGNPLQRLLLQRFHHTAAALVAQTRAQAVLDAGCGEGFAMQQVFHNYAASVVGVDASLGALHLADQLNPHYNFVDGNVLRLPFAMASFDLVVCMEVLEHLAEPMHGLAELCRVSRRSLLLSVPHEPWFRGANFLRGKNVSAWGNDPGHINHWSARTFARFVSNQCHIEAQRQSFPWTLMLCRVA